MKHSTNYVRVKHWYDMKMWNVERVRNAVSIGVITSEEYKEITGLDYKL